MRTKVGSVVLGLALVGSVGCNKNGLAGLPGHLTANPDHIDFGNIHEQHDQEETVVVTNVGNNDIRVTGLAISPPEAAQFTLDGTTPPSPTSPWVLHGHEWKPVYVHFAPLASGDQEAMLVVTNEGPELDVPLKGRGIHTQADTFSQQTTVGGIADILFMVDNSGSMSDKQNKLVASFQTFISWLTTKGVDFHIAVVTSDMDNPLQQGRFQGSPKVLDNTTPDIVNAFKANALVGDQGSGVEQGFAAAKAALTAPLAGAENTGFLRTNAKLFVVYLSDEDDQSPGTPLDQINAVKAVKGGDASKVFFASIAGPPPFGCFTFSDSAEAAPRYKSVTDTTQGLWGSICDANFGTTLQNLAFQVTAAQGTFVLTMQPDPATIVVTVNGAVQPPIAWAYDATTNSLSFLPGYVPAGNATVMITYDAL